MRPISNTKNNKIIMGIIGLMVALPALTFLIYTPGVADQEAEIIIFDSTSVKGYHYYLLNGVDVNEHSNIDLLNEIFQWVGTPHRSRAGRDGLDCSGLVKIVFSEVYDVRYTGSSADIFRNSHVISLEEIKEGDLVFFTIGSSRINHVGIYLNNNKFVHSSSSSGVTINDINEEYYSRYFYKAARAYF